MANTSTITGFFATYPMLFPILFIAVIGGFFVLMIRREIARRRAIGEWASANRWDFELRSNKLWAKPPAVGALLACEQALDQHGPWRNPAFRSYRHKADLPIGMTFKSARRIEYLFEYSYTVRHGKSSTTYTFVAHLFTGFERNEALPACLIRPEGLWDKMKAVFGSNDIDIPNDPAFSKAFYVEGDQETATIRYLDDRRRDSLKGKRFTIELGPAALLVLRTGKMDVKTLDSMIAENQSVFAELIRS